MLVQAARQGRTTPRCTPWPHSRPGCAATSGGPHALTSGICDRGGRAEGLVGLLLQAGEPERELGDDAHQPERRARLHARAATELAPGSWQGVRELAAARPPMIWVTAAVPTEPCLLILSWAAVPVTAVSLPRPQRGTWPSILRGTLRDIRNEGAMTGACCCRPCHWDLYMPVCAHTTCVLEAAGHGVVRAWLKYGCVALYTTGRPLPSTIVRLSTRSETAPQPRPTPCEPVETEPLSRVVSSTVLVGSAALPSSACAQSAVGICTLGHGV